MGESDRDRFDDADLQLPATTKLKPIEASVPQVATSYENESNKDEITVADILRTSGHIELAKKQEDILYAPIEEDRVQIRPDGLVYMPWVEYAKRLRRAFSLDYRFIPATKDPQLKDNYIYWGFYLMIKDSVIGYALGEQEYKPANKKMTWGDAVEGAKSNARMRVCKDIGLYPELWEPDWIKDWKKKHAYKYYDEEKKKYFWKKRGEPKDEPEEIPDSLEEIGTDDAPVEQEPPFPPPEPEKTPPPKPRKPPANVQIGDDPVPVEALKTKCKAEFGGWDTFLEYLVEKGCIEINPVLEKPDITTLTYGDARHFYQNFPDLKTFKQKLAL